MKKNTSSFFYRDKPLFGLDIGFSSIKVMQINKVGNRQIVIGYGVMDINSSGIQEGVVVDIEKIAQSVYELFNKYIVGEITTRRVAIGIPASRAYSRTMKLPKLDKKDLMEAVRLEAEQYIPIPIDELYMDYSVIKSTDKETELLAVAVPKKIIDSYAHLTKVLGLEAAAFETTISAGARLFVHSEPNDVPTILIDFGSISTDVTIYDRTLVVTGTVPGGGDVFTDSIAKKMGISHDEAHLIKTKYGLNMSK
jgi:type IV pilus assembly protein PilM